MLFGMETEGVPLRPVVCACGGVRRRMQMRNTENGEQVGPTWVESFCDRCEETIVTPA